MLLSKTDAFSGYPDNDRTTIPGTTETRLSTGLQTQGNPDYHNHDFLTKNQAQNHRSCYNLPTKQPISPSQVCKNHPSSGWVKMAGLKVGGCGNGFLSHNPKVFGCRTFFC